MGRPGLAPGIYFRAFLLGFFEDIDSERGTAWRTDDSLNLHDLLGVPASKLTPNHSTISRTQRLIDLEAHQAVFTRVLGMWSTAPDLSRARRPAWTRNVEGDAPVTFDRYTGQEDEDERRRISDSPPDILLTNFMMLELLVHRSDIAIA
jgi:hypothetical protein